MKKLIVISVLTLVLSTVFGANRYLVSGGDGNWNSTSNWSGSSGGSSGASYPVAGDVVVIDANSGNANLTVNVTSACASIAFANAYTGTFTMDAVLTTSSTVTLGSGMTITGTSSWTMNTSATITSAGKSFPALNLGGTSQTFTLADALTITGLLTLNGTTATTFSGAYGITCGSLTFTNNKTVTLSGNLTSTGTTTNTPSTTLNGAFTLSTTGLTATGTLAGTTAIKLTGGTWSGTGAISNSPFTFDGNTTVSGSVAYNSGNLVYSSGTITTSGSTLNCAANTTFNCAVISWDNVLLSGTSKTFTLSAALNISGTLTLSGTTATTFSGSYDINCANLTFSSAQTVTISGNLNVTSLTTVTSATTLNGAFNLSTAGFTSNATLGGNFSKIVFNGTGTWSGTAALAKNIDINTSGTLTISGTVNYSTGTLKYVAGTVIATGSTLSCSAATGFNTAGMNWNNITVAGTSQTHTLSSNLNLTGTLTLNGVTATTFSGAYNISAGNLTFTSAATVTIPASLTVTGLTTVTGNTTLNGSFTLYTGGLTMVGSLGGSFTDIVFNAKGTWSGSTAVSKGITINTSDTLILSGSIASSGNLTYTAGTLIKTGNTLTKSGNFNPGGANWNNITINGTTTLASACNLSGTLTVSSGTLSGAYNYNVGGGFTYTNSTALTGASSIVMNGKGTVSVTNTTGAISVPFTINTSDTITFGTNFRINNCAFTYTAGKIVSTNSTFETATTASTININAADFSMGTYLSSISQGFGGSNGFTIRTFNCPTSGKTFTFAAGKTYTITNEISIAGTASAHGAFVSGTPGTKAIVTLNQGASEDLGFCDATDIDSGNGKTILTYKGNVSSSTNWNLVPTTPKAGAFTFN